MSVVPSQLTDFSAAPGRKVAFQSYVWVKSREQQRWQEW